MLLGRIILFATALILAVIGIGFLWSPDGWAKGIEVIAETAMARTDIRATYGGFVLAAGVFLALCAFRTEWLRPGLLACGIIYAGFGSGRLLGIALEWQASPLMVFFLVVEIGGAALSFYAFSSLERPGR
jgi:uncharacterized protein YjeT (DUF2065 family)